MLMSQTPVRLVVRIFQFRFPRGPLSHELARLLSTLPSSHNSVIDGLHPFQTSPDQSPA